MAVARVLLVGINKYQHESDLKGCINDITAVGALLAARYGVTADRVRVLQDRDATTAAITGGLAWLGEGEAGPRLFHYSGHGSWLADDNDDELDHRDEGICPHEYSRARRNLLRDDTLRPLYERAATKGHLLLVMDSCHSGGSQKDPGPDVSYRFIQYPPGERLRVREAQRRRPMARQAQVRTFVEERLRAPAPPARPLAEDPDRIATLVEAALDRFTKKRYWLDVAGSDAVLLAACQADQAAAEDRIGGQHRGALTYHLLQALRHGGGLSYEDLMAQVGEHLETAGYSQVPQLECEPRNRGRSFLDQAP